VAAERSGQLAQVAAAALAAAGVISEDEFRPANAFADLQARMAAKS